MNHFIRIFYYLKNPSVLLIALAFIFELCLVVYIIKAFNDSDHDMVNFLGWLQSFPTIIIAIGIGFGVKSFKDSSKKDLTLIRSDVEDLINSEENTFFRKGDITIKESKIIRSIAWVNRDRNKPIGTQYPYLDGNAGGWFSIGNLSDNSIVAYIESTVIGEPRLSNEWINPIVHSPMKSEKIFVERGSTGKVFGLDIYNIDSAQEKHKLVFTPEEIQKLRSTETAFFLVVKATDEKIEDERILFYKGTVENLIKKANNSNNSGFVCRFD